MTARPDDPDFLELCPCCGGDGIYVDSCSDCAAQWSVGCTTCWLHNNAHTRADALAAWNRRAPAMAEELLALRAEVARLREDRLAAFDTCIKEAADLRNTQSPGQLSWWACNELLGRFHAARGKIARAALTPSAKEGRSDG